MRILFAEDDYASRKFTSSFLGSYGEVDITVNGEEAISAFQMMMEEGDFYDLICLDIMMPGKDGIEVLMEIREMEKKMQIPQEKKSKVIMLSALSDNSYKETAFEHGCDGYLCKPLDTDRFEALLKKLDLL